MNWCYGRSPRMPLSVSASPRSPYLLSCPCISLDARTSAANRLLTETLSDTSWSVKSCMFHAVSISAPWFQQPSWASSQSTRSKWIETSSTASPSCSKYPLRKACLFAEFSSARICCEWNPDDIMKARSCTACVTPVKSKSRTCSLSTTFPAPSTMMLRGWKSPCVVTMRWWKSHTCDTQSVGRSQGEGGHNQANPHIIK